MIEPEKRKAVYYLYSQGMPIKQIARSLQVDTKTVRTIILQKGELPNTRRSDTILISPELLSRLYGECDGYVQRIHEKLAEEHHIQIGYSTLTEKIRELELGKPINQRCEEGKEFPGAEMQHDTSGYKVRLGQNLVKLIASLLYFRYSKVRYLKFYRLYQKISADLFEKAVARALSYRITDPDTIYRIAVLQMREANYQAPRAYVDEGFINRPAFLKGRFTDDVDLSSYTHIGEDENGSGTDEDA